MATGGSTWVIFLLNTMWRKGKKYQLNKQQISLCVWLAAGFISSSVSAREWYVQPDVTLRLEADDNLLLRVDDSDDVFGLRASFFADYGTRTEASEINFTTSVDVYQYWGQDNLDRVNVNWGEQSHFQITERSKIGLDAAYVRDNSITSELDVTGLTQDPIPRDMFNLAPHWSYSLTELQFIETKYRHQEVTYDNTGVNTSLINYKTDSINFSYLYQWREDLQFFVAFGSLWYQVSNFDRDIQNYNVNAGLDYRYSETLNVNFMAGVRFSSSQSNFNGLQIEDSTIGSVFSLGLQKQFELGSLSMSYSRDISPSGAGELLQVDRFQVNSSYDLTAHLVVSLGAGVNITDSDNDQGRTYYFVEPQLSWQFSRYMSMSGAYRFRMQEYDNRDGNAISNGVFMSLHYQWDQFSNNRF